MSLGDKKFSFQAGREIGYESSALQVEKLDEPKSCYDNFEKKAGRS